MMAISAATVGCAGDEWETPPAILTAPPRPISSTVVLDSKPEATPTVLNLEPVEVVVPYLAPVPTAMVAASKELSTAEPALKETPRNFQAGVEQWRPLVESIFPAHAVETVLRIMQCESGGNPNATGAQGEMGLLQVHPRWHRDASYDPEANLRAAYRISGGGVSFSAWSCR